MQHEELEWGDGSGRSNVVHGRAPAGRDALRGEVAFASVEEQSQRCTELLGHGAVLITVPPPTKDVRGRLGEVLEELVERELARMGAPSPYLAAWSAMPEDAQARLADQLYRARTVGATGLAIALGSLSAIAAPVLAPDDSATLRWLAETTEEAPLVLLIDDSDVMLLGYAAPLPLGSLLATRKPLWELTPSPSVPVVATHAPLSEPSSAEDIADRLEDHSEPVVLTGEDATTNDTRVASIDAAEAIVQAGAPPASSRADELEAEGAITSREVDVAAEGVNGPEPLIVPEIVAETVRATPTESAPEPTTPDVTVAEPVDAAAPEPEPEPEPVIKAAPPPEPVKPSPRERRASRRVSAGVPVSGPNDYWRSWAIALSAARGPQPLAAFERLFAESYVPLSNAIASGLDDPRALRAYDEFRRSFERSYTDAFATFGATNRRPRLVMDAYDIAAKQARLSNARSAHVLLVNSMRFDLGCLVRDALAREATGAASLTSETLLWSALPTTTIRQIETFARGLDALRAPMREEPSESLRGRAAEVVRRVRAGSRELYKLDLVPALLAGTPDVVGSLEGIAAATAEAIARHVSTLPARTLLFVLGDHGFTVDRRGEVHTGGASPEEVLVPAFSWLVGELH